MDQTKSKKCQKCKGLLSLSSFPDNSNWKRGRIAWCKKCVSKKNRKSYLRRKDLIAIKNRNQRSVRNVYIRKLYHQSIKYKISCNLRSAIRRGIKLIISGSYHKEHALNLLGCTIEEFIYYIESKFRPGMTWQNWSLYGWHLDHIIPLSKFNWSDPLQYQKAFHYTNLQPLWAEENLRKHDNLMEDITLIPSDKELSKDHG